MIITGTTRLAGVIGWPITHSRSPILHNHWCRRHRIDGAYVPLAVMPGALETALAGLVAAGFAGANVTIPHKEDAFRLVTRRTRVAERAGSVNTLVFEPDGTITGDCTDGTGFLADLEACGISGVARVMILGAGGASRAIAAAFLDVGAEVTLTNRTRARAEALCDAMSGGRVVDWEAWPENLATCDLLVNATALGLNGAPGPDWEHFLRRGRPGLTVADIVYNPLKTPLLEVAERLGFRTVDGLGMLIQQARTGFQKWFGVWPDADAETRALLVATLGKT